MLAALVLAACADYPRDAEGTLDAVRDRGTIRVGVTEIPPSDMIVLQNVGRDLGRATGARMDLMVGDQERLLAQLEEGEIDIVAGLLAEDSPWIADVALIEPLTEQPAGQRKIGLTLAARNGENAWIGLLERTVRDAKPAS